MVMVAEVRMPPQHSHHYGKSIRKGRGRTIYMLYSAYQATKDAAGEAGGMCMYFENMEQKTASCWTNMGDLLKLSLEVSQ